MADATVVDKYQKATVSKDEVEQIQKNKLTNGAKTCTLTDDSTNWILTTVWPGQ
jgi:hypothetical protein